LLGLPSGAAATNAINLTIPAANTTRCETVTLQLVASAFPYETIWTLGAPNVSSMELSLPTADAAAISPESATQTTIAA
jgi:hypothetical protein